MLISPSTLLGFPEDLSSQKERSMADGPNSRGSKRVECIKLCIKGPEYGKPFPQKISLKCCKHTPYPSVFVPSLVPNQSLEFPPTTPATALWKFLSPERHFLSPSNQLQIMGPSEDPTTWFHFYPLPLMGNMARHE